MGKKARLGLYFETEEIRRRIIFAAAKLGLSPTAYCTRAIEERLVRDGVIGDLDEQKAFIARMDKSREEIVPTDTKPTENFRKSRRKP